MAKVRTIHSLDAEIIAIGTELLIGGRSDFNSLFLAEELGKLGITVRFKSVVGDERQDIVAAIQTAVKRAQVIVMTGGLGPTVDDCTREAVAYATGHRLGRRKEALEGMTARLAQWRRIPNRAQLRQAMIPSGATVLKNPIGDCLVTWRTAGNGRDDVAGSRPVAARSHRIVGPAFSVADRSSGISYIRLGGGGRRCQANRAHSERSAGRPGGARIAHGCVGFADDEGEPICSGAES